MDLVETGKPGELLPNVASGARSLSWWGMALLIATEATLFALLIASYWYLRFRAGPVWPPHGIEKPALGIALLTTDVPFRGGRFRAGPFPSRSVSVAVRAAILRRARNGGAPGPAGVSRSKQHD